MVKAPPTPKGFRDIPPAAAKRRREIIVKIADILEQSGFFPMETPTIEFAETLFGKYGDEEKLIYKFTDRGERELALRYDLTVPLARYIATLHPPLPFRRYQIGQVFRGENPQRGRWREFTQFDFDTVGSSDVSEDAKIMATAIACYRAIGLPKAIMVVNDRENFKDLAPEAIRAIDKLKKIGEAGVILELVAGGMNKTQAAQIVTNIRSKKPTPNLEKIFTILKKDYKLGEGRDFMFDPTLARGLDYYTSSIFEVMAENSPEALSVGGGGRFDNLIGSFSEKDIPAVGFSFGIDRLLEVMT